MNADGYVVIDTQLNTKQFESQIKEVEKKLNDMIADYDTMSKSKGFKANSQDAVTLRKEIERLSNRLVSLREQQDKVNKADLQNVQNAMNNVGKSTSGVIKKVLKWGLALFSIRSAYNFIRGSANMLSQSNEQIGSDIQYIRWALASTLQPIIETIIKSLYKLLQYVNYVANAWFGVNLFAKASTKQFEKANKTLKNTRKEAQKLQTAFDDMNVLQEDGSVANIGTTPQSDLSKMLGTGEIPSWVQWIADNGEIIKNIILGIGTAIASWKILELTTKLEQLGGSFKLLRTVLVGLGLASIFQGFTNIIKDWGGDLGKVIQDASDIIMGFGFVLLGINPTAWWSWASVGIGIIGNLVGELFKEKKALEDSTTATKNLKKAQQDLNKKSSEYTNAVENARTSTQNLKDAEDKYGITGKSIYDLVRLRIKSVSDLSDEEYAVYKAYLDNVDAQDNLKKTTIDLNDSQNKLRDSTAKVSGALYEETNQFDNNFKTIINGFDGTQESAERTRDYIFAMLSNMDKETRKVFIESLPPSITKAFETPKNIIRVLADGTEIAYKDIVNATKKTFETDLPNSLSKSTTKVGELFNKFSSIKNLIEKFTGIKINFSTGGVGYAKGGIVTKLATGGIVSRPNKGVPVASAYMGEAGREGIIPLTDAQAMETLGQAIGRYISINATVPIYMGNRQIAKEIRKIEAEDDFAYNQ